MSLKELTYEEAIKRLWKNKLSFSGSISKAEFKKDVNIIICFFSIIMAILIFLYSLIFSNAEGQIDLSGNLIIPFSIWGILHMIVIVALYARYLHGKKAK